MRTKEELQEGCAKLLLDIRKEAGLSRSRLADIIDLDERTVKRYESGDSAPSIPEFIAALDAIDTPCLPLILEYLYPGHYDKETRTDATHRRDAVSHFVENVATDKTVRELDFLLFGSHGSSVEAQMQMFCMLNHLPMDCRLVIAKMVLNFWDIASVRNELVCTDDVMPNPELLKDAIIKAQQAVYEGRRTYTTTSE